MAKGNSSNGLGALTRKKRLDNAGLSAAHFTACYRYLCKLRRDDGQMTLLPVANGVLQTPVPRHWTGETVGYGWQLFLCLVEKLRGSARTGRISERECH